jgi:hypothetical protein
LRDAEPIRQAVCARINSSSVLTDEDHLAGENAFGRGGDQNVDALEVWCTVWCAVAAPDPSVPYVSWTMQVDTWGADPERVDRVASGVHNLLHWRPDVASSGILPDLVGYRLADVITAEAAPVDMVDFESPRKIHHRPQQFRVATYPTS